MFLYVSIHSDGAYVRMVSVMSHKVERCIEHHITVSWDNDDD